MLHWRDVSEVETLTLSKMVSLFILVFASIALVRFAVSQGRLIWIATANQPLSESLRNTAGLESAAIGAQDFGSILNLCDSLSPGLKKTSPWLKEVSIYYSVVAKLEQIFRLKLPSMSKWANGEMQTCSRYVAVLLDQSLSTGLHRSLAARLN